MVTESIFDNGNIIIPMADVSHIEYQKHPTIGTNGIMVITKHTHYDMQADAWSNSCYIPESDKQDFITAWCRYRYELENSRP
jgi:hypothetical protein